MLYGLYSSIQTCYIKSGNKIEISSKSDLANLFKRPADSPRQTSVHGKMKIPRSLNLFYLSVMAVLVAIVFSMSFTRIFDPDEFFFSHISWKMLRGEKLYIDFLVLHHPLINFLIEPVIAFLGEKASTLLVLRVGMFLVFLLIITVTYRIAEEAFNKETASISVILLSSSVFFVTKVIEIRPDVPQTLTGLLSVLYLQRFLVKKNRTTLAAGAFFLALSFLFLQKTIFLMSIMTGFMVLMAAKKQIAFRDVLFFWAVFAASILPFCIYLVFTGALSNYILFNWKIHMNLLERVSASAWLARSFKMNAFFWIFYAAGLIYAVRTKAYWLALFSVALLGSLFMVKTQTPQYMLMATPLMAIISAYSLNRIFSDKRLLGLLIACGIAYPSYLLATNTIDNHRQLEKIDYIVSLTGPDEYVYDSNVIVNLFRKDLDFFWYTGTPQAGVLATYQHMTGYRYDKYKLIDEKKPRVITSRYIENMDDERIADHYVRSDVYRDLFVRARREK